MKRRKEELSKLSLDLGKLTFASLVLGFFQLTSPTPLTFAYAFTGVIIAFAFFWFGFQILKEVDKNGDK
jgi:hypothetical protein